VCLNPRRSGNPTQERRDQNEIRWLGNPTATPVLPGGLSNLLTSYSQAFSCLAFAFGTRSIATGFFQRKKKMSEEKKFFARERQHICGRKKQGRSGLDRP
jgi:hypothetical protein